MNEATGPRWSLRRRLALALAASIIALWLAATVAAGVMLRGEIDEVFDSALQEVAQRILPLAYAELLSRDTEGTQHMAPIGHEREYISYVVRDAQGKELLQSSDADLAQIPRDLPVGFNTVKHLRTYTESAVKGTIIVTTAEDLGHRRTALMRSVSALAWPLVALVPFALFAVWFSVRMALTPVDRFRQALEHRGRGNLLPVGTGDLPEEIAPVAVSVNALIERLRGALEAERSFTANSAHELRTPIAAALAQTQRLLAELTHEANRERAHAIAGSLRRLARLSEKLLQLAKAEGGGLIAAHPQPLAPVLRLVVSEIERDLDLDGRLELEVPDGQGPQSDIDPDAFAILARNLIENAVKHGDPEAPVLIRLRADRLEVENACAALPAERLEALTRPFERGPTSAEGSGLGLAIAAAVCRGAGLALKLASPVPGMEGGFRATVRFAPIPPEA
jgi:two-component system OmpR family sensor kinase